MGFKNLKNSSFYNMLCDDISERVASKINNNREICSLDIVNELKNSNSKNKKEILEYLDSNYLHEYTKDDIKQILKNQEEIDKEELKNSSLASNYQTTIRLFLGIAIFILIIVQVCSCCIVYDTDPNFTMSITAMPFLEKAFVIISNKICFIKNAYAGFTALALCMPFIFINIITKNKFFKILLCIVALLPFIFFAFTCFLEPYSKYGLINIECYALEMVFIIFFKQAKTLNKSDSYNIMILILTLISLAIGIYSIVAK